MSGTTPSTGAATPVLSAATREQVVRARDRYPSARSAILPALWALQEQLGWLAPEGMAEVAEILGMRPSEVQAVSTFYSMYFQRPAGRHHVLVCVNAPCALRGADQIVEHIGASLGVPSRGTTADGAFTWESTIECLGACGYAPMMQVDHIFHEHLTPATVDRILAEVRDQPVHHGPHGQGAGGAPAAAALVAAAADGATGRTATAERRRPARRDRATGHTTPQASPSIDDVQPVAGTRDDDLVEESPPAAETPVAPTSADTAPPAPGSEDGPEQAPRTVGEAARQPDRRTPRRGRRRRP